MPKLLVLFQSRHPDVVALADAAREGGRSVRFAEVDVRRIGAMDDVESSPSPSIGSWHRALEHADDMARYDGMILVLSPDSAANDSLLHTIATFGGSLHDRVGSVIAPPTDGAATQVVWEGLRVLAGRGMILVPGAGEASSPADESARRLGKRVAEVVGWVTHARSHHHHDAPREDHHGHHHHDRDAHHHH